MLTLSVTNVGLPGTVTLDSAITVRSTTHPTTTYSVLTTAQNTCLAGIAPGQSCTLPIEFAPTSSGIHDDLLSLTPSAGGGPTPTIVWLNGAGSPFKLLYTFADGANGVNSGAPVILDSQGNLYGTTVAGGIYNKGTAYKLDSGGKQSVLYNFTGGQHGGSSPAGPLLRDAQGNLYGTTAHGGTPQYGTVFRVDPSGHETQLYAFTGVNGDGEYPNSGVVMDANGNLYGATASGGSAGLGMIFKIDPSGAETVVHEFSGADGSAPTALTFDTAGNLYGVAVSGGSAGLGTIFEIEPSGTLTTLYNFPSAANGANPLSVQLDAQGNLYGSTSGGGAYGGGILYKLDPAGNETILYNFGRAFTNTLDGSNPNGPLVRDKSGNIYGTTANGGQFNQGTVFEVDTAGNGTTLYDFPQLDGTSGLPCAQAPAHPLAGLVSDSQGNLYGTTSTGSDPGCTAGFGTIFEILLSSSPLPQAQLSATSLQFGSVAVGSSETLPLTITNSGGGTLTFVPAFANSQPYSIAESTCEAGVAAGASCTLQVQFSPVLIGASDDVLTLYANGLLNPSVTLQGVGTGVTALAQSLQFGTVPDGTTEVLPLTVTNYGVPGTVKLGTAVTASGYKILATAQNTCLAGIANGQSCTLPIQFSPASTGKLDAVLTLTPSAGAVASTVQLAGIGGPPNTGPASPYSLFTLLHTFTSGADGANPSGLAMDATGNLYGTTQIGGASNAGTVFKIDTRGVESLLYTFTGGADGEGPQAPLALDSTGNLYGTTTRGGAAGDGTVFRLDPSGHETVLHAFTGSNGDGDGPAFGRLVFDSQSNLYGTTKYGGLKVGAKECGTVFKIDTGGVETVLYQFEGRADGCSPEQGLTIDSAGNLYGTTLGGTCAPCGTIFKLNPAGKKTTLYSFISFTNGEGFGPSGPLLLDAQGNLYGTTNYSPPHGPRAPLFKLDPADNELVFYTFDISPSGSLLMDKSGNIYGTSQGYGVSGGGAVYEVDAGGNETVLYSFPAPSGCAPNGNTPEQGLVTDAHGNLYGTTFLGGEGPGCSTGYGTVFELSQPPAP